MRAHHSMALFALFALLAACSRKPEQFVLFDAEFEFTKADADAHESHHFLKKLNPEQPKDWTSPVDYRNGTVHIRAEVKDKPAGGEITQWVLCYIPNHGTGNGYGCTGTGRYTEKGVYESDVKMTSWWENQAIDWTQGIKEMHLVMKDKDDAGGHAHKRADAEKFFPTRMRITMTQVAAGATFTPP